MNSPLIVESNNLSVAWGNAFLQVYQAGEISPLVVVINGLDDAEPSEIPVIRKALDTALEVTGTGLSCGRVANTIFPVSLWNPARHRHDLFKRYIKIFHRIRKHSGNQHGVYFQRLVGFGSDRNMDGGVNQLDKIIKTWNGGNHRRTALQAAIFDPWKDLTDQRQRGFPCLQQVAFARIGDDRLSVTGFYATQYMFERAYGNYLGLCRLGHFMAHEMGLRLSQVVCIATPAVRDGTKKALKGLSKQVEAGLSELANGAAATADGGVHFDDARESPDGAVQSTFFQARQKHRTNQFDLAG